MEKIVPQVVSHQASDTLSGSEVEDGTILLSVTSVVGRGKGENAFLESNYFTSPTRKSTYLFIRGNSWNINLAGEFASKKFSRVVRRDLIL